MINDALVALSSCQCCLLGGQQRSLKTMYFNLGKTEIYSDMLKECFDIRLSISSEKSGICEVCVGHLRDASNFKQQVQRSQLELRKRLKRALRILEEEPTTAVKREPNEGKTIYILLDHEESLVELSDDDEASPVTAICEGDVKSEEADEHATRDYPPDIEPAAVVKPETDEDDQHETNDNLSDDGHLIKSEKPDDATSDVVLPLAWSDTGSAGALSACSLSARARQQLAMTCSVRLERLNGLEAHACHICHMTFEHESSLATHMIEHYDSQIQTDTYICDVCKQQFTRKGDLDKHISTRAREKPLNCEIKGQSEEPGLPQDKVTLSEEGLLSQDKVTLSEERLLSQDKVTFSEEGLLSQDKVTLSEEGLLSQDKVTFSEEGLLSQDKVTLSEEGLLSQDKVTLSEEGLTKGKRIRQRDFCFYCETYILNFARHMVRHHPAEPEVQKALAAPKNSVIRKKVFRDLQKKGNYISNVQRSFKPVRKSRFSDKKYYLPCTKCLGFYSKKQLWKHKKQCDHNLPTKNPQVHAPNLDQTNINKELVAKHIVSEEAELRDENPISRPPNISNNPFHSSIAEVPLKDTTNNNPTKKKRTLTPWTSEQKDVVTKYFEDHIESKRPPKRAECDALKEKYTKLLQNKDWLKIKVYIQNCYTKK